ncbi:hypothetical protein C8J57DRAFT_707009 [Mycena rebaudengoi]|nr:hypothetical protein C8J57DRAFT_707009 [Mycena rebaudengoi]
MKGFSVIGRTVGPTVADAPPVTSYIPYLLENSAITLDRVQDLLAMLKICTLQSIETSAALNNLQLDFTLFFALFLTIMYNNQSPPLFPDASPYQSPGAPSGYNPGYGPPPGPPPSGYGPPPWPASCWIRTPSWCTFATAWDTDPLPVHLRHSRDTAVMPRRRVPRPLLRQEPTLANKLITSTIRRHPSSTVAIRGSTRLPAALLPSGIVRRMRLQPAPLTCRRRSSSTTARSSRGPSTRCNSRTSSTRSATGRKGRCASVSTISARTGSCAAASTTRATSSGSCALISDTSRRIS